MTIPNGLRHLVIEVPDFVDREFCQHMKARATALGFQAAMMLRAICARTAIWALMITCPEPTVRPAWRRALVIPTAT